MFYVYIYLHPITNIPIYVGKGCKLRYISHWNTIKSGKKTYNKLFSSRLKRLLDAGLEPIIKIINCESEDNAFELENFLVTEIGRVDLGTGPLSNLNDGGKGGMAGYILKDDHRAAIAKSNSEREHTEAMKTNFFGWNRGIPHSDELKAKISAGGKGKKRTPEQRERYRQAALNRTAEHKQNISNAKKRKLAE